MRIPRRRPDRRHYQHPLERVTALIRVYLFLRLGNGLGTAWSRRTDGFNVSTGEAERVQRYRHAVRLFDAVQDRVFA